MALADFLNRLRGLLVAPARVESRTTGAPTSSNGASSLHLFWQIDAPAADPFVEIGATLNVVEPPQVDRLYFWALQGSIADGNRIMGGTHLGLQHHPGYPNGGAANWGGYHGRDSGRSGELPGTALRAPSALDNPNTCNYSWLPNTEYRLRIHRSPDTGWRGSVTDIDKGTEFVVRDLHCPGDRLVSPIVWTESFARCDDAPAAVRWADLYGLTASGVTVAARTVSVNFQKVSDGGCSNTDSSFASGGFVQRTGTQRLTAQGSVLAVPRG